MDYHRDNHGNSIVTHIDMYPLSPNSHHVYSRWGLHFSLLGEIHVHLSFSYEAVNGSRGDRPCFGSTPFVFKTTRVAYNSNIFDRRVSNSNINTFDYYPPCFNDNSNMKLTSSTSTPITSSSFEYTTTVDAAERIQFLHEMEQTRHELAEFRRNMAGLLKQMDVIAIDLEKSEDKVCEIEHDITATEELNVNLQVLLEKAVKTQKESDVFATHAIKNMYSDLASVVYENNQLQGRLSSLESQQKEQKGSVYHILNRMSEYTQMLEQAQGTIHMLQEPRLVKIMPSTSFTTSSSRRTSINSFYMTDDDESITSFTRKESHITKPESIRTNYIQSPKLLPQTTSVIRPQQNLRMLFNNQKELGLGSIARK
ncbi:hypothetical protein BDB01DRAFT_836420 [Pilobolus umbonatus]|nr:hypothetical protein BDB01DRAFT_836420 [Pilobolus umbonatus]